MRIWHVGDDWRVVRGKVLDGEVAIATRCGDAAGSAA